MNTKHPLYKEKLKVERELYKLHEIQRNQNWVELSQPYKSGYYIDLDLRDDIKNRDDAWVFYECIRLIGRRAWWKDRSFKRKLGKGKYEYIYPGIGDISEDTFANLHPAVKKHFAPVSCWSKRWNPFRKIYECTVPPYYFVDKIKPRWITHYREHDSLIAQEEAEKYDYLHSDKFWKSFSWRADSAPKSYRQSYNRSDRRHSKQTLHKNIMNEDCDKYEYRYNHRHSATWDYW